MRGQTCIVRTNLTTFWLEAAALRRMVEGWGLSAAGVAAICAARAPLPPEDAAARLFGAPAATDAPVLPPARITLPLATRGTAARRDCDHGCAGAFARFPHSPAPAPHPSDLAQWRSIINLVAAGTAASDG